MEHLNIKEIMKALPHRYPFLMLDKIIHLEIGKSITALKNITINEPYFLGHFPQLPIMPGVLILETMAQAAGVLAHYSISEEGNSVPSLNLFAGIDQARFKKMVQPGDQLIIEVTFNKSKHDIYKFSAVAKVDGAVVCSAELLTARKEMQS